MKEDPCADTALKYYPPFYFKDELTIQRPFHVLQYKSRRGSKTRCILSWDIFVFALFFPHDETFLDVDLRDLDVSLVSHCEFDSKGRKITVGSAENNICHSVKKAGVKKCPDSNLQSIRLLKKST